MGAATIWLGTLGVLAASGAALDVVTRKLPNILCAIMLVAGLALAFATGAWTGLGLHFAHAAAAFVLGYVIYLTGLFGAGDAKFYTACAAFFPIADMLGLFVTIVGAGFVLLLAWMVAKRTIRTPKGADDFAKLPYGVAIAAGSIGYALLKLP